MGRLFPKTCHSEEWNDEKSPSMEQDLAVRETLRYAQSDRMITRVAG